MQRVLEKMASKLNAYDEASLMQLWQHYAEIVHEFEPTRRWEEAAISLCLIQAVHWKNQLFNYNLALTASPQDAGDMPPLPDYLSLKTKTETDQSPAGFKNKATVLAFPPRSGREED
ncbi:MAG: hypothetical protein LBN33_05525 [Desulfovibrio sp.]|jgi:hypothetical protein|nr:hypothetical protein [Desulfovibrio sp.]